MTTRRIAFLLVLVTLGMGIVYFIPKSSAQPSGIFLRLREELLDWSGRDEEITKKEIETLGKGTEFARKRYVCVKKEARGYEVLVSIVLSGHDMANSIHRPERCLNAQGWSILGSTSLLENLPKRGKFPLTRLRTSRLIKTPEGDRSQDAFTYYWFVGDREIAGSHWARWFTDNRDRLLRGVDQRWAFITVTGIIPHVKDQKFQQKAEEFADQYIRSLIAEIAPDIHKSGLSYE